MKRFLILLCLMFVSPLVYAQGQVITTVSEDFDGKLYVYDDKDEAERGLKINLSEKMERHLKKMGFSDDYIFTLLKKAVFSKLNVIEKRVEILKNNKKVKTTAFDVSGQISIDIDENDIRELAQCLKRFSPISDEERISYREALKNLLHLSTGIKDIDTEILRLKLSEIYKADIKKLTQATFGIENISFAILKERVVDLLNTIDISRDYLGDEANIREVTEGVVYGVDSYFKRSVIDVSNYQQAISAAEAIAQMMPYKKEETLASLLFIIEFKWGENIQNISQNSNVEMDRLYSETGGFVERFKDSKILKNIRARVEKRLVEELKDPEINYDRLQYVAFISDLLGLKDKGLFSLLSSRCEVVMEDVESGSDEQSEKVLKTFEICARSSPPDKKKKILMYKGRFAKTDKNRVYKSSLGNLAFVMVFVKYLPDLPFGGKRRQMSSDRFSDFLNEGQTTSGCTCSLDLTDECRIYNYAGEQYEVVTRYKDSVLYEISICNINLSGRGAVLISFLKENFRPLGKLNLQAFDEKDGVFDFEVRKGIILSLEKMGSRAGISVYDRAIKPRKDERGVSIKEEVDSVSFKQGDCVEWECDIECRYRGKVEKILSGELIVVITSAAKAAELNMRRNIKKSSVQKCSTP